MKYEQGTIASSIGLDFLVLLGDVKRIIYNILRFKILLLKL